MSFDFKARFDSKLKDSIALEYLFVTRPRFLSFSHRTIHSLRHPRTAFIQYLEESGINNNNPVVATNGTTTGMITSRRGRRASIDRPVKKLERLDLSTNVAYREEEEFTWVEIGHVFDSVCFEPGTELVAKCECVLQPWAVHRQVELWWNFLGCGKDRMTVEMYTALHRALFSTLMQEPISEIPLQILKNSIDVDWVVDSRGGSSVSYGQFAMSMLEIADNWTNCVDADGYAKFLAELLEKIKLWYEEPAIAPTKTADERAEEWKEVKKSIIRQVECFEGVLPRVIQTRDSTGKVVYEM